MRNLGLILSFEYLDLNFGKFSEFRNSLGNWECMLVSYKKKPLPVTLLLLAVRVAVIADRLDRLLEVLQVVGVVAVAAADGLLVEQQLGTSLGGTSG